MARDHFSKAMQSPYFQSDYYKKESPAGKYEKRIEDRFKKILNAIMIWRKK